MDCIWSQSQKINREAAEEPFSCEMVWSTKVNFEIAFATEEDLYL